MSRFDAYSKGFFGEEEEKTKASLSFDDFDAQFSKQFEQQPELEDLSKIDEKITKLPFNTMEEYKQSIQPLPPVNMPAYNENRQVLEASPVESIKQTLKTKSSLDELNAIPERRTPIAQKPGFNVTPTKMVQEKAPLPEPMISSPERAGEGYADIARANLEATRETLGFLNEAKNKALKPLREAVKKSREQRAFGEIKAPEKQTVIPYGAITEGFLDALLRMPEEDRYKAQTTLGKIGYWTGNIGESLLEFNKIAKAIPYIPLAQKIPLVGNWVAGIIRDVGAYSAKMAIDELAKEDPDIKAYKEAYKDSAPYMLAFGIAPLAGIKATKKDITLLENLLGRGYKFTTGGAVAFAESIRQGKTFEEAMLTGVEAGGMVALGGPRRVMDISFTPKHKALQQEYNNIIKNLPSGQQPAGLLQAPQNVLSKRPIKQDGPATIIKQLPTELYPGMPMTKEAGVQGPDAYFDRTLTGADPTAKQLPRFTGTDQIDIFGTGPTGMDTIEQTESPIKTMLLPQAEETTMILTEAKRIQVEMRKAMTRQDFKEARKLNNELKKLADDYARVTQPEPIRTQAGAGAALDKEPKQTPTLSGDLRNGITYKPTAETFIKDSMDYLNKEVTKLQKSADSYRAKGNNEVANILEGQITDYNSIDKDAFMAHVKENPEYYMNSNIDPFLRFKNRETNLAGSKPKPIEQAQKPLATKEAEIIPDAEQAKQPLMAEALKYDSAEEFVNSYGLYHGTPAEIEGGSLKFGAGSQLKKGGYMGGHFLSDTESIADVFSFGGKVYRASSEIKNKTLDVNKNKKLFKDMIGKEYESDGEMIEFTQQGYDAMFPNGKADWSTIDLDLVQKVAKKENKVGIAIPEYAGGKEGMTYQLFEDEIPIYTQQQLTDIYNEAHSLPKAQPTAQPADASKKINIYAIRDAGSPPGTYSIVTGTRPNEGSKRTVEYVGEFSLEAFNKVKPFIGRDSVAELKNRLDLSEPITPKATTTTKSTDSRQEVADRLKMSIGDTFNIVEPVGSLWNAKGNVIFISPKRANSGYSNWLTRQKLVNKVQEAGNNIYRVEVDMPKPKAQANDPMPKVEEYRGLNVIKDNTKRDGLYSAKVSGVRMTGSTLDILKRKIDKELDKPAKVVADTKYTNPGIPSKEFAKILALEGEMTPEYMRKKGIDLEKYAQGILWKVPKEFLPTVTVNIGKLVELSPKTKGKKIVIKWLNKEGKEQKEVFDMPLTEFNKTELTTPTRGDLIATQRKAGFSEPQVNSIVDQLTEARNKLIAEKGEGGTFPLGIVKGNVVTGDNLIGEGDITINVPDTTTEYKVPNTLHNIDKFIRAFGVKARTQSGELYSVGSFTEDIQRASAKVDAEIKPIDTIELVKLAKMLMDEAPSVKNLGATTRGKFISGGKGSILLNPTLFERGNEKQLASTLAHEIGHLIDYLPDRMLQRGNLLGRLASLQQFRQNFLPKFEAMDETGSIITPAERKVIMKKVESEIGKKPKDEAELKEWNKTRTDMYAKEIIKTADARGLVTSKELRDEMIKLSFEWRPIEGGENDSSYMSYRSSGKEIYADCLSALLNSPGYVQKKAPKFFELFFEYIDRKPEVKQAYIDIQKIMNGTPEEILKGRQADVREMFVKGEAIREQLEEKAKLRDNNIMERIRQWFDDKYYPVTNKIENEKRKGVIPKKEATHLLQELDLWTNDAYILTSKIDKDVLAPLKETGATMTDLSEYMFLKRIIGKTTLPVDDIIKLLKDQGLEDAFAQLGIEVVDTKLEATMKKVQIKLAEDMTEEIPVTSWEEQVEKWKKDHADREDLANPLGFDTATAEKQLQYLKEQIGEDAYNAIEKSADKYHDLIFDYTEKAVEAGVYSQEVFDTIIKPNKNYYVTFGVLDYLDNSVPSAIRGQGGTVKEVESPFITTILKTISLIRANAKNRAVSSAITELGNMFPEDVIESKRINIGGKTARFANPKIGKGQVKFLQDGKLVSYDVDKYIAESFAKDTPTMTALGANLNKFLGNKFFKSLVITYSPAFQVMNVIRDFKRTYINLNALGKNVTVLQLLSEYYKAIPVSVRRNMGIKDADIEEMMKNKALDIPFNDFNFDVRDDGFSRILKKFNVIGENKEAKTIQQKIIKQALKVDSAIRFVGNVIETLPKVTGYNVAKRKGTSDRDLGYITRNYVGTPNFRTKGNLTKVTNEIFVFSNIAKEGIKADARLATNPTTRAGYWWADFKMNYFPKLLMIAAVLGIAGKELKEFFDRVSEYDKTNFIIIPLGYDEEGRSRYWRLPHNESSRIMSAILYKVLTSGEQKKNQSVTDIFSVAGGILPSVSPTIGLVSGWGGYLAGKNPYDSFKGQYVLSDTVFNAGGIPSLSKMVQWSFNEVGLSQFTTYDDRRDTTFEATIKATPVINSYLRIIKTTDYGLQEKAMGIANAEKKEDAQRLLKRSDLFEKKLKGYNISDIDKLLNTEGITPERIKLKQELKDITKELYDKPARNDYETTKKAFIKYAMREQNNPYVKAFLSAQSNDAKVKILKEAKETLSVARYNEIVQKLKRVKLLSPDIVKKLQKF